MILARIAPKTVWWPGSTQICWGSLSTPPDPLATMGEATLRPDSYVAFKMLAAMY